MADFYYQINLFYQLPIADIQGLGQEICQVLFTSRAGWGGGGGEFDIQ